MPSPSQVSETDASDNQFVSRQTIFDPSAAIGPAHFKGKCTVHLSELPRALAFVPSVLDRVAGCVHATTPIASAVRSVKLRGARIGPSMVVCISVPFAPTEASMEYLPVIGASLLSHGPLYAVWLVGVIFAALRWKRHPRVSLFAILALVLTMFLSIVAMSFSIILPLYMHRDGMPAERISIFIGVWSLVTSTLQAGCWVLLLIALFGWRGEPATAKAASMP